MNLPLFSRPEQRTRAICGLVGTGSSYPRNASGVSHENIFNFAIYMTACGHVVRRGYFVARGICSYWDGTFTVLHCICIVLYCIVLRCIEL